VKPKCQERRDHRDDLQEKVEEEGDVNEGFSY